MVVPLGQGLGWSENLDFLPVPTEIQERHAPYWWALLVLLAVTASVEVAGQAVFNAINTLIVGYLVWYMVRNSCQSMSPECLMLVGFLSSFQGVLNFIIVCSMLPGRREQTTERTHFDSSSGSAEYKVKVEWHAFFDPSRGAQYNLQSLAWLLSPITLLATALLCYWSHKAFDIPVSEYTAAISNRLGHGNRLMDAGGGTAPRQGRASYGATGAPGGAVLGGSGGSPFAPFEGSGQRLGGGC